MIIDEHVEEVQKLMSNPFPESERNKLEIRCILLWFEIITHVAFIEYRKRFSVGCDMNKYTLMEDLANKAVTEYFEKYPEEKKKIEEQFEKYTVI